METRNNNMTFEVLKGTQDIEPKTMIQINKITDTIRNNFESYGFRPFDTPLIEYWETLTNKYQETDEIVNEIFKLSDRGERKLGLRYDLTVPLCRYISEKKQLKLPFRRYAIGKVYRDGPIKKGRQREFMQCDADVIGITGVEIEAELLSMFYNTYIELKITAIIEINNNKILRGALIQQGFKEEDLASLILSIDKLKKIGIDGVISETNEKGFDKTKVENAIKILSSKSLEEIEKQSKNELLIEGINELKYLSALLKELEVEYRINFSMSRGLNIYTGNIWESYDKNNTISSSLGSGGRYDKAIGNFIGDDKEYPAVGVSFGVVPMMAVLENNQEQKEGVTEILIVPLEKELTIEALKLSQKIRKEEKNTEIIYSYKLKKAFDYAEYIGAEKIVILGKKDLENKQYTIKNLKTGKEEKKSL